MAKIIIDLPNTTGRFVWDANGNLVRAQEVGGRTVGGLLAVHWSQTHQPPLAMNIFRKEPTMKEQLRYAKRAVVRRFICFVFVDFLLTVA